MNLAITITLILSGFLAAQPAWSSQVLEEGTPIPLRLKHSHWSHEVREGQRIQLYVAKDIKDADGNLILKKGAPALGVITACSAAQKKAGGSLQILASEATAADGSKIKLTGMKTGKGPDGIGGGACVASMCLLGFPVGPPNGQNIKLWKRTKVNAFVGQQLTVASETERKDSI